jgi:hypothetical protein
VCAFTGKVPPFAYRAVFEMAPLEPIVGHGQPTYPSAETSRMRTLAPTGAIDRRHPRVLFQGDPFLIAR